MSSFSVLERRAKEQTPCIRPAWDLNQLIRIQQAGNWLCYPDLKFMLTGKALKSVNFSHWRRHLILMERNLLLLKPHQMQKQKWKIWNMACPSFKSDPKVGHPRSATRFLSLLPGWTIVVSVWTKYLVTRKIKTGIHKLSIRTGQRSL